MTSTSHKLLALCVALACSCGDHTLDVDEGSPEVGMHPDDAEPPVAPSPCLATLYPAEFEGEFCSAFSLLPSDSPTPGVCAGCFCAEACTVDADCPPTPDDQAEHRCDPHGWCVFDCSEAPCPEGMHCIPTTRWDRPICHWVVPDEHPACEVIGS
jgi:hypothetical protein